MEKQTIGATLLHIVCCGLILAIALGGLGFLTQNWWVLIVAGIVLVVSPYLLLARKKMKYDKKMAGIHRTD